MNAEERQQAIVDAVARDGRVTVSDLAVDFEVTVETVRRDLTALDRRGALRKVHGGAVAATVRATPETDGAQPFCSTRALPSALSPGTCLAGST